jgi:hypothetical protein
LDYKSMMTNQAKTQGKESLYPYTIGVISAIIDDDIYDADEKVSDILQVLIEMKKASNDESLPWNIKKPSTAMEGGRETNHSDCIMDASKIEPLVDPVWAEKVLRQGGILK